MTMPKFEPDAFLFQHEDTGLTSAVDVQQVEWGFEKNNPRHINCGPLYTAEKLVEAYEAGQMEQAAQIEMLRKMLKQVCGSYLLEHPDTNIDPFVEALSSTPDQALEQFAAKVREQCANKVYIHWFVSNAQYWHAIRAIKELP